MKKTVIVIVVLAVLCAVGFGIKYYLDGRLYRNKAFYSGNGRIEATEIMITAKHQNRIVKINVKEGDYVEPGDVLVEMDTKQLRANLEQAKASKASAEAMVEVRNRELEAAKATLAKCESTLKNAKQEYERQTELLKQNVSAKQKHENAETAYHARQAEYEAAEATVKQAEANVMVAKANINAAQAEIDSIQVDIDDCYLVAPVKGRIQYRIAETGEVVGAGGRVLNLVDLTDVYMTFFLPEEIAGKVKQGAAVRIILDAAPDEPIPAKVTYIESVAQFTPKTVETRVERQKLMFRCKAHIEQSLLEKYIDMVKTGLPGVAWIQLDDGVDWPAELQSDHLGPKNKEFPITVGASNTNALPNQKSVEKTEPAAAEAQAPAAAEVKPEAQAPAAAEAKPEAKPAPAAQPAAKAPAAAEAKPEAKPAPAAQPAAKAPAAQPAAKAPAAKVEVKAAPAAGKEQGK